MTFEDLADGWVVWNEEPTKCILAYRPDVFDSTAFPAPCLPTIYLTKGKRSRRPGRDRPASDDPWYVTLFLEPEVDHGGETYESREAAVEGTKDLAARFAKGEIDVHELYQVPREEYLAKLDELTGQQ
ncbi:DUF5820 family protein [Halorientalis brevis]|uniref:DUF5820 family protein n=1 Tax=Halorientalis brevis TaxID=1126241 RepID=A0ABD6CFK1_9EURY|nr:DUF5820 family protein [Halorientalis brevis]